MPRSRVSMVLIGAVVAPLLFASSADSARTADVSIGEYFFRSARLQVDVGDTVRWTNRGKDLHTVTSSGRVPERFDAGNLDAGQTFTRTFRKPGTYTYVCTLHEGLMSGTVQVGPDTERPRIAVPRVQVGASRLRVKLTLSERSTLAVRLTRSGRTVSRRTVKPLERGRRSFAVARPRTPGAYRLTVVASDAARNRSKSTSVRFRLR